MLAKRLTRAGVTLSGAGLTAALAQEAASAWTPLALVAATVRAATAYAAGPTATGVVVSAPVAALTEGVVKAMLLTKLKIGVWFLVGIGIAGTGWGSLSYPTLAQDQPPVPSKQKQVAQAGVKPSPTVHPAQEKASKDRPQGKDGELGEKDTSDRYREAILTAFQISSAIVRAMGKQAPQEKKPPEQDQAKQMLDLVLKELQAYQGSQGKEGERPDKAALGLYGEAFLRAFQISRELAQTQGQGQAKRRPEDPEALDAYGPAFRQAYERAKTLKQALDEQKASDGKRGENLLEALDLFLKSGKEFEQAIKHHAKTRAVQQARREIEHTLSKVAKMAHDKRAELETLEEIGRVLQEMKKQTQQRADGK
jgi:hypothetical protein